MLRHISRITFNFVDLFYWEIKNKDSVTKHIYNPQAGFNCP